MLRKVPAISAVRPNDRVICSALQRDATTISSAVRWSGNAAQFKVLVVDRDRRAFNRRGRTTDSQITRNRNVTAAINSETLRSTRTNANRIRTSKVNTVCCI